MKIRNISGDDLIVPWLGGRLVEHGDSVDVGADVLAYLAATATWEPADAEATAAAEAAQSSEQPADPAPAPTTAL